MSNVISGAGGFDRSSSARILPAIDPGTAQSPRAAGVYDDRSGLHYALRDLAIMRRPHGGRLLRDGNNTPRGQRRAVARRNGRRR